MELQDKLRALTRAAKYDASCSSSGSSRKAGSDRLGSAAASGICHSWSEDGRCISLLKILFTSRCIYDCAYCVNRISNDRPRASFTPEELARLTVNFYRRNYIEGLFLSSAIEKSPDHTMERICRAVEILREEYNFGGYVHLKAIPGADYKLIEKAGRLADRLSANIELPSRESFNSLAPDKDSEDILSSMSEIGEDIEQNREERQKYSSTPRFVPAGQSTQLIVGASPEPDYQIIRLSESLYENMNLKRVYYSAFMPVSRDRRLPRLNRPPLLREHRLYQADWLIRRYNFSAGELLDEENPALDRELDPKSNWALNNFEKFPVEINRADYDLLIRVPGIGLKSARRIVSARQQGAVDMETLRDIGPVLKRAKYFITCRGKYPAAIPFKRELIRERLTAGGENKQLSLFREDSDPKVKAGDKDGAV